MTKTKLLAGTALMGALIASAPAMAEVNLELGGYFSGYGIWSDNDQANLRELDIRREGYLSATGETTLDNGLTVGFYTGQLLGGATLTDEAYAYFSGSWGRVNLGSEDGAAYLLQVAAPSADGNIDGIRITLQALAPETPMTQFYRFSDTTVSLDTDSLDFNTISPNFGGGTNLDYDHTTDPSTTSADRITYLSPKMGGFQAGVSYAPEQGQNDVANATSSPGADNALGALYDGGAGNTSFGGTTRYDNIWEASVRWDGEFEGFGISAGGGYSSADLERAAAIVSTNTGNIGVTDGVDAWNAGLSLTWNGFSLGGNYLHAEQGITGAVQQGATESLASGDVERTTWVAGLGWDNGPWHLGATYLNQETETPSLGAPTAAGGNLNDVFFRATSNEVEKVTLGGGYTFGPGMSFRASVAFGEYDAGGSTFAAGVATAVPDSSFTQVAIGTQIDF